MTTDPRSSQPASGPVLAIDVGTSSAKAALLDQTGAVLEDAQASLSTTRGPDGRMHQHLDDWQDAVRAVIADCLRGNGSRSPAPSPLAAVSVTGQMQDLVLLDEHGRPTHPVVLYSDTHARSELADLSRANPTWAPSIAVTPPPGPDALPPKLLHVARTAPTAYAASRTVLFSAAGWVAHALTGDAVCDRLTASTTGLYDPRTDDWIPLQSPDGTAPDTGPRSGPDPLVPAHLRLPRLVDPGIVGPVGAQAARTFGVPAGTPVVLALGDAGSATDGTVGSEPGDVYLHLGTTGWVAHVDPTPAAQLPLPDETGETVDRHRLAHPAGHLAIARLPEAGEALARARRDLLDLTDPHSPGAHAIAEAALVQPPTSTSARAATPDGAAATRAAAAYGEVVEALAADVAALLERLGAGPTRLPATGGVARSPMVRQFIEQAVGVPVDVMGVGGPGGARSAAGSGGEMTLTASDAGLLSCARVAFDALGVEHTVTPLAQRS